MNCLLPRHNLIAFYHKFQPISILASCDSGQKVVRWNPARTTTEYVNIVDPEKERFSMRVILLDKFVSSETSLLSGFVKFLAVLENADSYVVL